MEGASPCAASDKQKPTQTSPTSHQRCRPAEPVSSVKFDSARTALSLRAMTDESSDFLQRIMMAQGGAAFFQAMGAQVVAAVPGKSTMRLPYAPHLVGNPDTGVVHGGVITGLLDHACGMAVGSALAAAD